MSPPSARRVTLRRVWRALGRRRSLYGRGLGFVFRDVEGVRGDGDLARLALFGLGDTDLEHAAVDVRIDRFGADAVGHGQRARERPKVALEAVVALLGSLVIGVALAGDREHAILDFDRDVVS